MAEEKPNKEETDKSGFGIDLSSLQDLALGPTWSSGQPPKTAPKKDYNQEEDDGRRRPRGGPKRDRRGTRPPRRDQQGDQQEDRPRGRGGNSGPGRGQQRRFERPFEPTVDINFYPEDAPFKALTQAIKTSCRTYELFEIARLILEKPERFVAVVKPLAANPGAKLFVSVPDGAAFESESEAAEYVLGKYLDRYFEVEEVEAEPPKGNFTVVNKCGITGELLGPPNYHRYQQFLQHHHATRLPNTSFERFQSRIESVRDEEAINAWLEKMRKQTRLRLKSEDEGVRKEFDNLESARFHLLLHNKDQVVREAQTARFPGKLLEDMPPQSSVRKSAESYLELQRRFPLETANNLRGRLRRMNFSVYKKGTKGVSYVCAVKRQFRMPGQTFSESIQQLIDFLQEHPNFQASHLPKEYLGLEVPEGGEQELPDTDREPLRQLRADLRWLIASGYVTEFSDGRLYAPEARDTGNPDQTEREDPEPDEVAEKPSGVTDPVEAVKRVEAGEELPTEAAESEKANADEQVAEPPATPPAEEAETSAEKGEAEALADSGEGAPSPATEQKVEAPLEEKDSAGESADVSEKKEPQVSTTRLAGEDIAEGKAVAGQNAEVEPVKGEEQPDEDTPGVKDEPTPEDHNKQERDPNDGDPGKATDTQDPNKV